jgi:hypothetical protein
VPVVGWVILAVFVLFVAGGAAWVVASDRKRNPFRVSDAELQTTFPMLIDASPAGASALASAAIHRIGGGGVVMSDDRSRVAGWIGSTSTHIPSRQEYELLIDIRSSTVGHEFRCLSRPRFSSSLGGAPGSGVWPRS